jgi:FkbM family methyltransferase
VLLETDTRYGRIVVPDARNDIISRFLVEYGEWADLEVQFVSSVVAEGASVADIGAFIGTFGLGMQLQKQLSSICFVEANPEIVPLLKENVKRNCHVRYAVVDGLVAPRNFRVNGSREAHNFGSASFLASEPAPERIAVPMPGHRFTLRQIERKYGPFDLIKLDVEGMELAILASETGILERKNTTFWIECNEHERSLELAEIILSHGRNIYYFAFPSFNPDNFRANQTQIFPFAYEAGLLSCSVEPQLVSVLADKGCILRSITNREDLRKALWQTPRWAPHEWWNVPTEQLVALAVHQLNQEVFEDFLTPTGAPGERSEVSGSQSHLAKALAHAQKLVAERDAALREHQAALAHAQALVAERDAAIARVHSRLAERRSYMIAREGQLRATEQALRRATERLTALETQREAERGAREEIERAAAHRLALLCAERDMRIVLEAQIFAITTSTSWRATARLRALLTNRPRLRRTTKWIVRGFARVFLGRR